MRIVAVLLIACLSATAHGANEIDAKVDAALAADSRPEADRERDRNRMPKETLNFFGLKDNMTVIELMPGGGWYTRVLGPVLAENGKLLVAMGTGRIQETVLTEPGFEKVVVLETSDNYHRPEGSRHYTADEFEFGVDGVDMVLTFRNIHNFGDEGRERINRAVYDALKPGGLYGVVDHTRRHMEPGNRENGRRVDPVLAIREIEATGFEFVEVGS